VVIFGRGYVLRSHREPILGTVLTTRITAANERIAHRVEGVLLAHIDRLESIFSIYDPLSELNRWKRGERRVPGQELQALLADALRWQVMSGGVFNPASGVMTERWKQAEREQQLPDADELAQLANEIRQAPFQPDGTQVGDCTSLSFNAFAKGRVVDIATSLALADGATDMLVNIGGDLVHLGQKPVTVAVEDPRKDYDNAPPLATVALGVRGMATSGLAKRGYRINDTWYSHVIDPRTGWPVDHVSSASVVARDASTADALATVLSVLSPDEGLAWLQKHQPGTAACVVPPLGEIRTNEAWTAISRLTDT
jgi:FAD:protein FMN transferase